jgi:hypothetical protein
MFLPGNYIGRAEARHNSINSPWVHRRKRIPYRQLDLDKEHRYMSLEVPHKDSPISAEVLEKQTNLGAVFHKKRVPRTKEYQAYEFGEYTNTWQLVHFLSLHEVSLCEKW